MMKNEDNNNNKYKGYNNYSDYDDGILGYLQVFGDIISFLVQALIFPFSIDLMIWRSKIIDKRGMKRALKEGDMEEYNNWKMLYEADIEYFENRKKSRSK